VRTEIARVCFERDAIAKETIVACGKDAAFPHNRGEGPLKANEFIVVDIFPRLIESGYYGDMTRTPSKQSKVEQFPRSMKGRMPKKFTKIM
jgi:Xaa-Pro aminopeptidase